MLLLFVKYLYGYSICSNLYFPNKKTNNVSLFIVTYFGIASFNLVDHVFFCCEMGETIPVCLRRCVSETSYFKWVSPSCCSILPCFISLPSARLKADLLILNVPRISSGSLLSLSGITPPFSFRC